jgi:DNA-directed RNA polymerase sigma subunit (sigma70/sigma32)
MINEEIVKLIENFLRENYTRFSVVLGKREKDILALRKQGKSMQYIGDKMKISKQRVCQLEEQAKERINASRIIAEKLYIALKDYLFDDKDIEVVFLKWYSDNVNPNYPMAKLDWQKLEKMLWESKRK